MREPIVACAALLAFSSFAAGETKKVPGDFATVQAAVDAAASGDVILCGPGTFNETVAATKSDITIIGNGTVINGGAGAGAASCLKLEGSGNTVKGIGFTGGTTQVVLTGAANKVQGCSSVNAGTAFCAIQGDTAKGTSCTVEGAKGAGAAAISIAGNASYVAFTSLKTCAGKGIQVIGNGAKVGKTTCTGVTGTAIDVKGEAALVAFAALNECKGSGIVVNGGTCKVGKVTETGQVGTAVKVTGNAAYAAFFKLNGCNRGGPQVSRDTRQAGEGTCVGQGN